MQATHDQLVTTLCQYRPSLAENKKVWEDGKILSAQEAVEQKLIDKACDKGQLFEDIFAKLNLPFDPDLMRPVNLNALCLVPILKKKQRLVS